MSSSTQPAHQQPVAVFDFDGTCIHGQSGFLVSWWLLRHGNLSLRTVIKLWLWGARYTLHLPNDQETARKLIFDDLMGLDAQQIDDLLVAFHREVLVPRYRSRAMDEVRRRREEGCRTVLISATFETIAREAMRYLGTDGCVATKMERDAIGRYTGHVDGDVVEGEYKIAALKEWADDEVGEGRWTIAYAYGDHHSDAELLARAEHPVAVNASPVLKVEAARRGWDLQNWNRAPRRAR